MISSLTFRPSLISLTGGMRRALLVILARLSVEAARHRSTHIQMVSTVGAPANQLALVEDGSDQRHVRQVGTPSEGVVQDDGIPRAEPVRSDLVDGVTDRVGKGTQMDRQELPWLTNSVRALKMAQE